MRFNKKSVTNNNTRLISSILLTALLAVLLFSSYYIITEADHDCNEASCPICTVIKQCEDNLKQIGTGCVVMIIAAIVLCNLSQSFTAIQTTIHSETLITQKVRLND